jgi:hypothetical protein
MRPFPGPYAVILGIIMIPAKNKDKTPIANQNIAFVSGVALHRAGDACREF